MRVAALFAGIGGIERGLEAAGHETILWSENDPSAVRVLEKRFGAVPDHALDVRSVTSLPAEADLVTAGFPCQDLSQAGRTKGINGTQSGLVTQVFRLLDDRRIPWVLIENVPFMLQLERGAGMEFLVTELERRGYNWAYRILDTRAFGLPQRRKRVFLLASRDESPENLLLSEDAGEPGYPDHRGRACGFYWTEGNRGLGWAVDAVPTIKGGSGLGIPSPPGIWLPDGRIVKPDIRDAERLQGFPADWTQPAEEVGKASYRWKLVGNAVSVPAARYVGEILKRAPSSPTGRVESLQRKGSWPDAAFGAAGRGWYSVDVSHFPVRVQAPALADFLAFPPAPLSKKATAGFLGRLKASSLRYPRSFEEALEAHLSTYAPA
jgi:DNA (cytosine-5)-methyltransferase 1